MHADITQENNLTHTQSNPTPSTVSELSEMKPNPAEPVSCSNDCATTESYTIPLLESRYGNIPSCS